MKKGDVWRVRLPPVPGHAQVGDRPAVILQEDSYAASLTTVLVVPFTGTVSAAQFAGTLLVNPDGQNGLTMPSVALVFQLRALDRRNFLNKLGTLDAGTLDQLFDLLDLLTGR